MVRNVGIDWNLSEVAAGAMVPPFSGSRAGHLLKVSRFVPDRYMLAKSFNL